MCFLKKLQQNCISFKGKANLELLVSSLLQQRIQIILECYITGLILLQTVLGLCAENKSTSTHWMLSVRHFKMAVEVYSSQRGMQLILMSSEGVFAPAGSVWSDQPLECFPPGLDHTCGEKTLKAVSVKQLIPGQAQLHSYWHSHVKTVWTKYMREAGIH